jgi:hypothetical protein
MNSAELTGGQAANASISNTTDGNAANATDTSKDSTPGMGFEFGIMSKQIHPYRNAGSLVSTKHLQFIVAISFAIIALTLTLAFSTWIRSLIWYLHVVVSSKLSNKTELYKHKRWPNFGWPQQRLIAEAVELTERLEEKIRMHRWDEKTKKVRAEVKQRKRAKEMEEREQIEKQKGVASTTSSAALGHPSTGNLNGRSGGPRQRRGGGDGSSGQWWPFKGKQKASDPEEANGNT